MTPETPETEVIDEMETPVEITQDEMIDSRYSYDLPQNDAGQGEMKTDANTATPALPASEAPEQDNQSEIPGDPRESHQTQPPTSEQY
ncbi:MAG: hypothetical protein H8F28_17060 [Fibrella sp.]|nr:hypothetical protein [Armatimonadota bacterium]